MEFPPKKAGSVSSDLHGRQPKDSVTVIQKAFRCPVELDAQLNRAKGAIMLKTGQSLSHNQFLIHLLEIGLGVLRDRREIPE